MDVLSPEEGRAQQWHDTDHGSCEAGGYSSCWCCCTQCDPDWGHDRPNPYWTEARATMLKELGPS